MQNQKTLKKVLEELNKDNPRLDYIKGMLEVLVEDEKPTMTMIDSGKIPVEYRMTPLEPVVDEASIMEAETRAFIAKNGMPKAEIE